MMTLVEVPRVTLGRWQVRFPLGVQGLPLRGYRCWGAGRSRGGAGLGSGARDWRYRAIMLVSADTWLAREVRCGGGGDRGRL